jgi:hypothetical protein
LILYLFAALPILEFGMASLNIENEMKLFQLGSINIFAIDYLMLILSIILLLTIIDKCLLKKIPLNCLFSSPITKVVIMLFLWNIMIGLLSYFKGFSLQNVLRHLAIEALMLIAIFTPTIKNIEAKKEHFFNYLILLGIILVCIGSWKFMTHQIGYTSSGTMRTLEANSVVMLLIPLCYILFLKKSQPSFLHSRLLMAFMIIGIVFAGHRSGFIALIFVILMYFITYNFNKLYLLGIPFTLIFVLSMLFFIPLIYEITPGKSLAGDFIIRFNDTVNLENKTTNNRLNRWSYSAEVLKKNPFLGLGRFPVKTAHLEKGENINLKYFTDLERGAHNVFIGKLIHEGLLGLGIIIFFFWFIINKFKKINFTNKMYGSFLKIYLVSFILFSMFNTSYTNSEGRIFFFIILGFLNTEIFIDRLSKRKTELNDAIMFHQR